ncbi:Cysteine synthase 2 [Podosphaera aphanis]|nr:Cysteine synthase 2 [Podosphaera aphanis]
MTTLPQLNRFRSSTVSLALLSGFIFALGLKEFCAALARRDQQRRKEPPSTDFRPKDFHTEFAGLQNHTTEFSLATAESAPQDIPEGIESLIGNTPLFKIKSLSEATGCIILAKAEFLNGAGGSTKDRVALNVIRKAEGEGLLVPGRGDTIYEGTVGSTGISLAILAKSMGYKAHICMPSDQSQEKVDLLRSLGAHVERVKPAPITSAEHFVNLAKRRAVEHNKLDSQSMGFFVDQFENHANFQAHFSSTGPEIWTQTQGFLDAFVAGAGTGGTLSGIALYLKEEMGMGSKLRVVLADPEGSGLYNKVKYGVMYSNTEKEGTRRRHQIDTIVEGIGINRLTENFEAGRELIDDAIKVTDLQALNMARWLVEKDGIFVGSSSAVNCVAAVTTALNMPKGSRIVTILCDSGTRHLSKFWKRISEIELKDSVEEMSLPSLIGIG